LAAFHIRTSQGRCTDGRTAAITYIEQTREYQKIVSAALTVAREPGPDGGAGDSAHASGKLDSATSKKEKWTRLSAANSIPVYPVRRFAEKPALENREKYLASGITMERGMFFWRVDRFSRAEKNIYRRPLPHWKCWLRKSAHKSTQRQIRKVYSKLENISVDYAVLERATRDVLVPKVFVIPRKLAGADYWIMGGRYELLAKIAG